MFLYKDMKCPVCDEMFSEQDDVVSCPDCGAPHHRTCWTENGQCRYSGRHGTEEQWVRPSRPEEGSTISCAQCGAVNLTEADRCAFCGENLSSDMPRQTVNREQADAERNLPPVVPAEDPMGGVHSGEHFGEIPAGDVAIFVEQNKAYYMRRFWQIAKTKTMGGLNLAALIFPGLWMIYRKMYKLGAVIMGVTGLARLAIVYVQNTYLLPIVDGLSARSGYTGNIGDREAFARLYAEVAKLSGQDRLMFLLWMLLSLISLAIGITIACIGNKLYYNHCIKSIEGVRQRSADLEQYNTELVQWGGVNRMAVLSIVFCYILITSIF